MLVVEKMMTRENLSVYVDGWDCENGDGESIICDEKGRRFLY